ncbi:hypothetical protein QQG55_2745 [Brugia pahangi]
MSKDTCFTFHACSNDFAAISSNLGLCGMYWKRPNIMCSYILCIHSICTDNSIFELLGLLIYIGKGLAIFFFSANFPECYIHHSYQFHIFAESSNLLYYSVIVN